MNEERAAQISAKADAAMSRVANDPGQYRNLLIYGFSLANSLRIDPALKQKGRALLQYVSRAEQAGQDLREEAAETIEFLDAVDSDKSESPTYLQPHVTEILPIP